MSNPMTLPSIVVVLSQIVHGLARKRERKTKCICRVIHPLSPTGSNVANAAIAMTLNTSEADSRHRNCRYLLHSIEDTSGESFHRNTSSTTTHSRQLHRESLWTREERDWPVP